MEVVGIGVDIIENIRITKVFKNKKFINRIFTKSEINQSKKLTYKTNYFAKRFAAKEAIIKALKSSGFKKPTPFCSIEIESGVDGKPIVNLHFSCKGKCRVSISHTESHAIASAIFISK